MTPVQIEIDDLDSGGLVILLKAAAAVLKATGQVRVVQHMSPTNWYPLPHTIERWPPLAQRNIWNAIDAGVAQRMLNPVVSVDADKRNAHAPLSRGQCADGVVSFAELATWGRAIGLYDFIEPVASESAATQKVAAGATAKGLPAIPGKLPPVAIGKLAITAAWRIEYESDRVATADKVIECLQKWADDGTYPDVLLKSDKKSHGVIWRLKKTGLEKGYDIGACGKTLETWMKSRDRAESGDTGQRAGTLGM